MINESNPVLMMSDGHYLGQYQAIFDDAYAKAGKLQLAFNVGDLTAVLCGNEVEHDPGYRAKLDVLAAGGTHEEGAAAQQNAWNTHLKGMLEYALTAPYIARDNLMVIARGEYDDTTPYVVDIQGNSDVIIEGVTKRAQEILNKGGLEINLKTSGDHLSDLSENTLGQVSNHVYDDTFGSALFLGVPFTKDESTEQEYVREFMFHVNHHSIIWRQPKKVMLMFHECPIPGEFGVARPPQMKSLKFMADYARLKFDARVDINVVSGHIHAFPPDKDFSKVDGVNYYPIGINDLGGIRYLLVDDESNIDVHDLQMERSPSQIKRLKESYRKEARVDEIIAEFEKLTGKKVEDVGVTP